MTTPTTPLDPLVSDTKIDRLIRKWLTDFKDSVPHPAMAVRDIYEADRSKDKEVMREKDERIAELEMSLLRLLALSDHLIDKLHSAKNSQPPFEPNAQLYAREALSLDRDDFGRLKATTETPAALLSKLNERINNKDA